MVYEFKAKLWKYRLQNPEETIGLWVFVSVPKEYCEEIKEASGDAKKGFGSVKVEVTIGSSTWRTSLFPDSKEGAYLLPIKKDIRNKESVAIDDEVEVLIKLLNL